MKTREDKQKLLGGYRVLDLADEKGDFCTQVLASLGADVIKVERPEGSPTRGIGPFLKDTLGSKQSLYWNAYNRGKRGITLNIDCDDGKDLLRDLCATADIVVESFKPGYLAARGLGYEILNRLNSALVLTSITPFGQNGSYCDFSASDLVCWSMGGFAYLTGDADRPPVQVSFPQAYLAGSLEAAVATMMALYYRELSGEGQHVDVSIQASVAKNLMNAPLFWETNGVNLRRAGAFRVGITLSTGQRVIWPCRDGAVSFFFWGGKGGARTNRSLVECMDEEGIVPEFMKEINWDEFDMAVAARDLFEKINEHVGEYFRSHTKKELFEKAIKKKMTLYPVQDASDIVADESLRAAGFWEDIYHEHLQTLLNFPGLPFILSDKELTAQGRRAPLLGEHNEEIYRGELGLSLEEMASLKEREVL
jgi:benzylsuccinate CoA-transferase BbsE subunit